MLRPLLAGLLLLFLGLSPASAQGAKETALAAVITVSEEITEFTAREFELRLGESMERKPRFLIVKLDTPGGLVTASEDIANKLRRVAERSKVETIAYVTRDALSGGTMIALACRRIVMAPDARIGDVLPIQLQRTIFGEKFDPKVAEKLVSPIRATLETYAADNGYPELLARAMVDPDHEEILRVRIPLGPKKVDLRYFTRSQLEALPEADRASISRVETVLAARKLLTLTAGRAQEFGFAWRANVTSVEELCRELALESGLKRVEPYSPQNLWWISLLRSFNNPWAKTLLFALGAICLLISLVKPGLIVPEILCALCFGLAFFSSYMVGLAGYVEVLIFLLGFALLALEIFVLPGFGICGVSGIACIMASFLLILQGFLIPTTSAEWTQFFENLVRTMVSFVIIIAAAAVTLRYLPKTGALGAILLSGEQRAGEPAIIAGAIHEDSASLIGQRGVVQTILRPTGELRLGDKLLDAISEERVIEVGVEVEIVGLRGFQVIVRPAPKELAYDPDSPLMARKEAERLAAEEAASQSSDGAREEAE